MKRILIPQPPNADAPEFRTNPMAFNRAASDWMRRLKGILEDASRINDAPMGQQFQIGSFSTNTTLAGTSTLGDVANFVCSLTTALTSKGLVSPTVTRTA